MKDFLAKGYRIVDLEVRSSTPTLRRGVRQELRHLPARLVVVLRARPAPRSRPSCPTTKARLIDIEPYSTGNGTRYAVVMVKNSGAAKKAWGWHYNVPLSTVTDYADDHDMRVDRRRTPRQRQPVLGDLHQEHRRRRQGLVALLQPDLRPVKQKITDLKARPTQPRAAQ